MKLTEILSNLPFYEPSRPIEKINISKIEMDHRNINNGDLFVCIRGFSVDGHDFAKLAVENGACAVLADRPLNISVPTIVVSDTNRALALIATSFYKFPSEKMPLIGITGTNGKTTTSYLIEAIFNENKQKTGLIGTIQMKIGETSYPVKNTTPDALSLQKTFDHMYHERVETVIMEVSSHALELGRVYGCDFDVAVFTNLSQDHLDYHETMEQYLTAKSYLFSQLGNTYTNDRPKFAIVNNDDPYSAYIKKSTAQHILTYGCETKSDVMATHIELSASQTTFDVLTPVGTMSIQSDLIGMFNVYNMLAAITVAISRNISLDVIKKALEKINGIDGRFEQVNIGQQYAVIVDFAHTPDSLENVLETIREFAERKIYVVVGCGGDRDRSKRPKMAEISLKYADHAIFTSDNPRTEDPADILSDMTDGLSETHFEVIKDRRQAISQAIQYATEKDVVLIAGKGHETYQEINHVKYDFDDRVIAEEAIKQKEHA